MNALWFTAKFAVVSVISINVFGFLFALLLTRGMKGSNVFRSVFFMPNLIGGIVLGYIWQLIINGILYKFGVTLTFSAKYGFWGLVVLMNWQLIGYMMIIYIAGIQNVPDDLIEAAKIDGAGPFKILTSVVIPMMMPAFTICLFLTISNSFKLFDQNLALTAGAPSKKTAMLALDIYNTFYGTTGWEGVGQAKAVIFFILVGIFAFIQLKLTRSREVEKLMELKLKRTKNVLLLVLLLILSVAFLFPIFIVVMNSFKGKLYISDTPFVLPNSKTFAGLQNYLDGLVKTGFASAFGWSLFITVCSVAVIVLFTSMTGWYITRVKTALTKGLYYLFVFSMIVPFQMVMFTMVKFANTLHLDNPIGIIVIYLGFGAGLSVFMFSGFVKSIPVDIEEASIIDGCNPIQTYFLVVVPILSPIMVTVAILNTMWIWNDYLLPYLLIGSEYKTIPIAIQYLKGGYGSIDMGAMMAMLVLAIVPIVVFYFTCQKYIIKGVTSGAVKG